MLTTIARHISYAPRHKVVIADHKLKGLEYLDMGYELAEGIAESSDTRYIAFEAEEKIKSLISHNKHSNPIIGNYVALDNWAILFEADLQINIVSLFKKHSKDTTLILTSIGGYDCINQTLYLSGSQQSKYRLNMSELFPLNLSL